jgi:hypothetical protein
MYLILLGKAVYGLKYMAGTGHTLIPLIFIHCERDDSGLGLYDWIKIPPAAVRISRKE